MKSLKEELKIIENKLNINNNLKEAYLESMKSTHFKKLTETIGLPDEELIKHTSKLNKTVEDLKRCKNCNGLNECKNEMTGFIYYPVIYNNILKFEYKSCKYKKIDTQNNMYKKYIYRLEEPKEILNATIKNIFTTDENRYEVIKYITEFLENYNKTKKFMKGIYLHGSFGSGKTYLISSLLNELAKKKIEIAIIYYPELLRSIKASFNQDYDEKFNYIKEVTILLLDDIGAENTTNYSRDEILGPILQHRMQENLTTFFTSNLSIKELEAHFSITKDSVDKLKARRIVERIKYLADEKKLVSINYREN